ncbi:hypothetical protein EXIGLDRAFT_717913 [Exidia glandulosa HHB12029]|uniref:F-box domain-containing protein n=1 Tax=Exidia glandulosa HHB12029 TaxID=1314781 RepID=A0A165P130_EXIGL|nr:hypothetical protein EXIGLDRAFT_717913 [Exidia glandulosa HHB12029]
MSDVIPPSGSSAEGPAPGADVSSDAALRLPLEVLIAVMPHCSPRTLAHAAATCSTLRTEVEPLLYRDVRIFSWSKLAILCDTLSQNEIHRTYVRRLSILTWDIRYPVQRRPKKYKGQGLQHMANASSATIAAFASVLAALIHLESFESIWLTHEVLKSLPPSLQRFTLYTDLTADVVDAISALPNLVHLSIASQLWSLSHVTHVCRLFPSRSLEKLQEVHAPSCCMQAIVRARRNSLPMMSISVSFGNDWDPVALSAGTCLVEALTIGREAFVPDPRVISFFAEQDNFRKLRLLQCYGSRAIAETALRSFAYLEEFVFMPEDQETMTYLVGGDFITLAGPSLFHVMLRGMDFTAHFRRREEGWCLTFGRRV